MTPTHPTPPHPELERKRALEEASLLLRTVYTTIATAVADMEEEEDKFCALLSVGEEKYWQAASLSLAAL